MTTHNRYPILLSTVAAFGGFLFGFDSAVINGTVRALEKTFNSGSVGTGFSVSSMLLGSALGAFYAGQLADRVGRKRTMVLTSAVFAMGSVGAALAPTATVFVLFRIMGGVGVGAASVIAPAYIAEVSPAHLRGRLGSLQQLAIVIGIFVAFVSNYLFGLAAGSAEARFWLGLEAWRWMLGVQLIPSLAYGIGALLVPESPRYLVPRGREQEAEHVLVRIGEPSPAQKIREIRETAWHDQRPKLSDLLDGGSIRPIVWVGVGLAVLQQLVGINVVFYYGAVLWQSVGFTESQSLLINVISGAVNITTTLVGMTIIDRFGRRPVLMVGSLGMAVTLALVGWAFSQATLNAAGDPTLAGPIATTALVAANLYIVFFGFSWGPVVWVMLGEMFNNRIRGSAMSVCTASNWISNFAITMTFPILLRAFGLPAAYSCYAAAAFLSFFFVRRYVRETKGLELESMV